jgi:putative phosphoserine phosphatase/1-acylglycerol-3-phosphate O-acyltransferase
MIAAYFDMDRTLLSDSSSLLWMRYMRQRGELTTRQLFHLAPVLLRYKLGLLDIPALTRSLVADLTGHPEAERVAFTRRWFDEQLVDYVAEEGRRVLETHRQWGHRLVIITASPIYTASPLAEHLQIAPDDVLATRVEVRNGHFTGRVVEPMCYREGKLQWAERHAARHGIELASSYFYTDSIDDLSLLERVGHPIAVNPDKPLQRQAEQRGWPVVRFY